MSSLQGKVAVVTGASKGIGAGIAKALATAGAAVVVNYASDKAGADAVVAEITGSGGKAIAVGGSVAKAEEVVGLFTQAKQAFGALDILVNNAGVFAFAPLEAVEEAEFHRQFDINVLGTILAIQEAAKHFGPAGGSVVNISSVASLGAMPGSVVYAATKAAVDSVTRVLAMELAPKKIRVNTVAPGMTVTEGASKLEFFQGAVGEQIAAGLPMGRMGLAGRHRPHRRLPRLRRRLVADRRAHRGLRWTALNTQPCHAERDHPPLSLSSEGEKARRRAADNGTLRRKDRRHYGRHERNRAGDSAAFCGGGRAGDRDRTNPGDDRIRAGDAG